MLTPITDEMLQRRFELAKGQCFPERLVKSPGLTRVCVVSEQLQISYGEQDEGTLPCLREQLSRAHAYVEGWLGAEHGLVFDLWVAPTLMDLRYMHGQPCGEGFFGAPATREGRAVLIGLSSRARSASCTGESYTGSLAHVIALHCIRTLARATENSLERKQAGDLPMWLESGLSLAIHFELDTRLANTYHRQLREPHEWCAFADLWDDLMRSSDTKTAFLQAYAGVQLLLRSYGKGHVLNLLSRNAERQADWSALGARMDEAFANRPVGERRPAVA